MMRFMRRIVWLAVFVALVAGCAPTAKTTPLAPGDVALTVRGADVERTYTLEQLGALPATDSQSDDGAFTGVRLSDLLTDAGFDLSQVATVRIVAQDGFSSTYETALFTREDVILAYAREGGDLKADERPLRMVAPGEEGFMQPRMVTTIEVSPVQ